EARSVRALAVEEAERAQGRPGLTAQPAGSALMTNPVVDHAKIEDAEEGLVTRRAVPLEELPEIIRCQQASRLQFTFQKELAHPVLVASPCGAEILRKVAFASSVPDRLRQFVRERRPGQRSVSAAGDPHPRRCLQARLDHRLRQQW